MRAAACAAIAAAIAASRTRGIGAQSRQGPRRVAISCQGPLHKSAVTAEPGGNPSLTTSKNGDSSVTVRFDTRNPRQAMKAPTVSVTQDVTRGVRGRTAAWPGARCAASAEREFFSTDPRLDADARAIRGAESMDPGIRIVAAQCRAEVSRRALDYPCASAGSLRRGRECQQL